MTGGPNHFIKPGMGFLNWDLALLAEQLCGVLAGAEAALEQEQAVKGLDDLDERALQILLAEGLGANHQVAREVHYPSSTGRKNTHRPRCDLVLTVVDPAGGSRPASALWLEVKVARQLSESGGRHPGYTGRWHAVIADLRKMMLDPAIQQGALVLVLFTESEGILEKDLDAFENLLVRQRVIAGFRHVRTFPVQDRIGHRFCSVAIWPT